MISVIIPAHNEAANIVNTTNTIRQILEEAMIEFELIFIDDGSTDTTYALISSEHQKDARIRGIRFSRNFGKEAAIKAGLAKFSGDCAAVIDCDLQHPPKVLVSMYQLWQEGYQIVEGIKSSRGSESALHHLSSKIFYSMISKSVKINMYTSSDFKLLDKKVADIIAALPESDTFFRALTYWVGFKTTSISYDVADRQFGETKWSTWKLIKYAIRNVTSFSSFPLQIITLLGVLLFILFMILGIQTLFMYFSGRAAVGFTTVILLLLFIGSTLMISLGIIGMYISKIYDEIKQRPQYLIQEETK